MFAPSSYRGQRMLGYTDTIKHEGKCRHISTKTDGATTTLVLEGWLDTTTASELADALAGIDSSCEALVIDLTALEYISSAGLRQLVSAYKQMNGNLTICNVSGEVMQVFRMAGFDKRLNIV